MRYYIIVLMQIEIIPGQVAGFKSSALRFRKWNSVFGRQKLVAFIQVGPPGYFTNISITTPIVPALKNYYR
jgi:hypothetical protein